jgi:hypothetical protein
MSNSVYHLAQVNIARMLTSLEDPRMADFVANLDPINALADSAPGFVWRFKTDAGDATAVRPYADDRIIINTSPFPSTMSVRRAQTNQSPPAHTPGASNEGRLQYHGRLAFRT